MGSGPRTLLEVVRDTLRLKCYFPRNEKISKKLADDLARLQAYAEQGQPDKRPIRY